jgi:hypothetical protein
MHQELTDAEAIAVVRKRIAGEAAKIDSYTRLLVSDLCTRFQERLDAGRPIQRSWSNAWGIFDRRRDR